MCWLQINENTGQENRLTEVCCNEKQLKITFCLDDETVSTVSHYYQYLRLESKLKGGMNCYVHNHNINAP